MLLISFQLFTHRPQFLSMTSHHQVRMCSEADRDLAPTSTPTSNFPQQQSPCRKNSLATTNLATRNDGGVPGNFPPEKLLQGTSRTSHKLSLQGIFLVNNSQFFVDFFFVLFLLKRSRYTHRESIFCFISFFIYINDYLEMFLLF